MGRLIEQQAVIDCLTNTAKYYDMPQADEWTKGIHYGLLHGIDNILDNVKPVEAIPKDQYENRLKADMVAILVELQMEIEELDTPNNGSAYIDCVEIIQQKINELKADQEGGEMTNGEKFKKIFKISQAQVDEGELYAYVWLPTHDAIEIPLEWWNAEYKEPTTKNDLGVDCIVDVLGSYTDLDIPYKREIAEDILTKLCSVTPQESKTGHCKDCKWWKDSDGEYRRGCGAESQCPINRKEVFEGNGYCYMFEPQESEG